MKTSFAIQGETIELIKLLKASGFCGTGGTAKIVVSEGLVRVDGETERRKRRKLHKGQQVEFDGNTIVVM